MPMPMTIEMNMTEKSERCPMTSVATPSDQQRLVVSTSSMSTGLPTRRNAARSRPSVSANARIVACWLSRKADVISSLESAGLPVTPTSMFGYSRRSFAITARTPSIARWSPVKLPRSLSGSARMKRSRWSSDRKYPTPGLSAPPTAKSVPQGEW